MCPLHRWTQNIHKSCQTYQRLRIEDVDDDSDYKDDYKDVDLYTMTMMKALMMTLVDHIDVIDYDKHNALQFSWW